MNRKILTEGYKPKRPRDAAVNGYQAKPAKSVQQPSAPPPPKATSALVKPATGVK